MQAWRFNMKVFGKTLGLLLASLALASCGGSGSNGGAFSPASSTITLSATTTTLPVNTAGYTPAQYGNPTQATVTITWRNPNGSLVSGQTVTASISPPNVAALSCLAPTGSGSGTTTSACVLGQLYGSIPIDSINGQATVFVNALTTAGPATLVVSGVDPTTSQTVSASLTFNVTSGVGPAPASVSLVANPTGVYLPGSGGTNTSSISATVLDGAGQFVPDPVSGNSSVDNIQFQIVGNAGNATLTSSSGSGTTVSSHTVHGVAVVSFQAGDQTPQGPVQIRATVDRADNNVSNGIQDPVSFTISVIVSDGKLYSLEITSPLGAPNLPGITINCVVNTTANPCTPVSSSVTPSSAAIPPNPDATLSLVVTAKAQDRQGNPVLPGTPIRFGSVDEPVGAPGSAQDNQFLLSGLDGNPQEGGTLFTAPTGHFTTAGGGAGPGDALIVFGKAVQGNADLESAVTVQSVTSATSLVVSPAFNLNDTTGVSVDYGAVLPYLIGRSEHGSITAAATTDANLPTGTPPAGIAHAILTYTINSVGDAVAIWAQGDGVDRVTNGVDRVTDAATLDYPGVAPLSIFASPNPIFGNATQTVTVCVTDALGIKLRGLTLGYKFTLTGGTGSIAGSPPGSGALGQPTGLNGCVNAVVTTSGVPISAAGGNSGTLTFNAGSATATVDIVVQLASLQASQTCVAVNKDPQTSTITIAALSTGGTTIPGVAISAACTASGGNAAALTATPANATTGANGSATFSITATGFPGASPPGTGQCVFTSAGGTSQSVTVTFGGVNAGGSGFSPPGGCG
jgi:hypothetical protein